jgi:hypothetical protein
MDMCLIIVKGPLLTFQIYKVLFKFKRYSELASSVI